MHFIHPFAADIHTPQCMYNVKAHCNFLKFGFFHQFSLLVSTRCVLSLLYSISDTTLIFVPGMRMSGINDPFEYLLLETIFGIGIPPTANKCIK
jgi:hypothetical protein